MERRHVVSEGKSLAEAIQNGLRELNKTMDEVDVVVLQTGKEIFGFQTTKFKVKLVEKKSKAESTIAKETFTDTFSEDGRCEIKSTEEGKFLYIFPPKGQGKPVKMDEIVSTLMNHGIFSFDVQKIRMFMNKKSVSYIRIDDIQQDAPMGVQIDTEISTDELAAYLMIIPPQDGEETITEEKIYDVLTSRMIVKGIDSAAIKDIIQEKRFFKSYKIASGQQPQDGQDGEIRYLFETEVKIKPTVLEDGRVDLKELNIIQTVSKGQCLAEKIPHTEGVDGFTVTGKVLKAKPGKPVIFKKGKNVIETEDGLRLLADAAGQPKLIDGKVTVLEIYEVNGNVDNTTGNIRFNGKVVVKGNVRTGFTIEANGDVEIYGVVEGAIINAEGDILLHKGIQGQNVGKLISKGSIVARYMENCYAKAQKTIHADSIMHCIIESGDTITAAGRKGLIVGGEVKANHEVNAKFIGSPMATVTKIEVGIDPEEKERYEQLKKEETSLKQNKNQVTQIINLLTKMSKTAPLTEEKQNLLQKSINTEAVLTEKLQKITEELKNLNNQLIALSNGKVNVSTTIYPGVQIYIGNSVYYVREEIQHSTFLKKDGEIQIAPYMGTY